uniref:NGFI-A-binding protein 1-like isoform X2 n=1 Tax=Petromyzon marinus TaxID=7757 RepID=A0AAJ7TCM9_PETMA|nr:NGFI-A-binding protein 1-like isoform X2 [Petromyzon marinus]
MEELAPQPRTLGELQLFRVLQRANLLSYYQTFVEQGGDDVHQLCDAEQEEFLEIMALVGMASKPLHVRRLQKALQEWVNNPSVFSQVLPAFACASIPISKISNITTATATEGLNLGPKQATTGSASAGASTRVVVENHKSVSSTTTTTTTGKQHLAPNPGVTAMGVASSNAKQCLPSVSGSVSCTARNTPASVASNACRVNSNSGSSSSSSSLGIITSTIANTGCGSGSNGGGNSFGRENGLTHGSTRAAWPGDVADTGVCGVGGGNAAGATDDGALSAGSSGDGDGPGGELDPETRRIITECSAQALGPAHRPLERAEVQEVLRANKKMAAHMGHIFEMDDGDERREDEIRKFSAIYGRFDSRRKDGKQLTQHELSVNEAACQLCLLDMSLLTRRDELFPLARQVVRESGYKYSQRYSSRVRPVEGPVCKRPRIEAGVIPASCQETSTSRTLQAQITKLKRQDRMVEVQEALRAIPLKQDGLKQRMHEAQDKQDLSSAHSFQAELEQVTMEQLSLIQEQTDLIKKQRRSDRYFQAKARSHGTASDDDGEDYGDTDSSGDEMRHEPPGCGGCGDAGDAPSPRHNGPPDPHEPSQGPTGVQPPSWKHSLAADEPRPRTRHQLTGQPLKQEPAWSDTEEGGGSSTGRGSQTEQEEWETQVKEEQRNSC